MVEMAMASITIFSFLFGIVGFVFKIWIINPLSTAIENLQRLRNRIERSDCVQVKSDIIQDVINRAKTAVRNFGENAQIELPAELVKNICQNLNAERYRLAKLNKKYSALKQQVKMR